MDINPEILEDARSNIRWLALNNPTVHAFLTRYHKGEINYEQALTLMVLALAEQNEQLIKEATRIKEEVEKMEYADFLSLE